MGTDRKPTERECTAYHEAGHAVVTYLVGRELDHISIDHEDESSGRCQELHRYVTESREAVEDEVMILLAGRIAEERFKGEPVADRLTASDDHDAADMASFVYSDPEELDAYLKLLAIRTKNLVGEPGTWSAIMLVATELQATGHIDGVRIAELIAQSATQKG